MELEFPQITPELIIAFLVFGVCCFFSGRFSHIFNGKGAGKNKLRVDLAMLGSPAEESKDSNGCYPDASGQNWKVNMKPRPQQKTLQAADATESETVKLANGVHIVSEPGVVFTEMSELTEEAIMGEEMLVCAGGARIPIKMKPDGRCSDESHQAVLRQCPMPGQAAPELKWSYRRPFLHAKMDKTSGYASAKSPYVSSVILGCFITGEVICKTTPKVDLESGSRVPRASSRTAPRGTPTGRPYNPYYDGQGAGSSNPYKVGQGAGHCNPYNAGQGVDRKLVVSTHSIHPEGGPQFYTDQIAGKNFSEAVMHIKKWAQQASMCPATWTVIAVEVTDPATAESTTVAVEEPHLVCFGEMGAGKSTLLNAIFGGRKSESGQPYFQAYDTAKSGTQKPQTEISEVYCDRERLNFRLTDVPGFADRSRKNSATMECLKVHLEQHDAPLAHGIIIAHDYNQPRLSQGTIESIKSLENVFGDQIWDYLCIVFTKFEPPRGIDEESIRKKTRELTASKCLDWQRTISQSFPHAARKLPEQRQMFFFVNSQALLMSDAEISNMKARKGSVAGQGLHCEVMKSLSQAEINQLLTTIKRRKCCGEGLNFVSGEPATERCTHGPATNREDVDKLPPLQHREQRQVALETPSVIYPLSDYHLRDSHSTQGVSLPLPDPESSGDNLQPQLQTDRSGLQSEEAFNVDVPGESYGVHEPSSHIHDSGEHPMPSHGAQQPFPLGEPVAGYGKVANQPNRSHVPPHANHHTGAQYSSCDQQAFDWNAKPRDGTNLGYHYPQQQQHWGRAAM
jgi:GTP-binding protein EngB required for normal cell division